jgi:hypothetical protein
MASAYVVCLMFSVRPKVTDVTRGIQELWDFLLNLFSRFNGLISKDIFSVNVQNMMALKTVNGKKMNFIKIIRTLKIKLI